MPLKVLLASMNVGGGHAALRDSLHASLREADPSGKRYQPIDWDSADQSIHRFYRTVVYRMPRLQGALVDLCERDWIPGALAALHPAILSEAREVLRKTAPDAVVSTHFLLSLMLAKARHQLDLGVPMVSAIPDYGIPPRGFIPSDPALRADAVLVMDPQAKRSLLERRATESQVELSGFLPRTPFRELGAGVNQNAKLLAALRGSLLEQLRKQYPSMKAISPERPTFLFLAGSAWARRTRPVIDRLLSNPTLASKVNLIVACGKDQAFYRRLSERYGETPNVNIFGFVPSAVMAKLMALADYPVLGSLAPATLQELLEVGCGPLFLFRFIPGTENPHVLYIEDNGLGVYEPDVEHMVAQLAQAAGLAAASCKIEALKRGFHERAVLVRAESARRAMRFPQFLESISRRA